MRLILKFLYVFYAALVIISAYWVDPVHDYAGYLQHWQMILDGEDPWKKMHAANAYGPIYNLFAYLYAIEHQLPKLFFVASWLFIAIYSVVNFSKVAESNRTEKFVFALFWLANPFFLLSTISYGFNDSFVAFLVFVGLISTIYYNRSKLAVFFISLAVLVKIYPIFLLPFIDTIKTKLIDNFKVFIIMFLTVYGVTFIVWGGSFLNAFGKANGRDPTLFSIMRFLDGKYFPFETLGDFIILFSNLFILIGVFYVFYLFQRQKIAKHTALLASITILFTFYKAGQFQFFITYFAVFSVWSLIEFRIENPNKAAFYAVIVLGLWFAVMVGVVYPLSIGYNGNYEYIRDIIGLPTFLMEIAILYFLLSKKYQQPLKKIKA